MKIQTLLFVILTALMAFSLGACATDGNPPGSTLRTASGATAPANVGHSGTALEKAVMAPDVVKVRSLLAEGGDPNETCDKGYTLAMKAAALGHTEVLKVLIAAGADVSRVNPNNGKTAMSLAVDYKQTAVVELLLAHEADASKGNTPLMTAVDRGYKHIVAFLLAELNSDVSDDIIEATNNVGDTALVLAVKRGETAIATLLLEKEANAAVTVKAPESDLPDGLSNPLDLLDIAQHAVFPHWNSGEENRAALVALIRRYTSGSQPQQVG